MNLKKKIESPDRLKDFFFADGLAKFSPQADDGLVAFLSSLVDNLAFSPIGPDVHA